MAERETPEFFRLLLDRESNIKSADLDWYRANMKARVLDYWAVERPGRIVRSWEDGTPVRERVTVAEFLERTGVAELFAEVGPAGISAVQAAVVNPWGFVGYQFGEALLIDLQYYRPASQEATVEGRQVSLPCYYASLPDSTWRGGRRHCVYRDEWSGLVRIGTDVNTWQGTFTGKDGVASFADLRDYGRQLAVLRASLRHNAGIMSRYLADRAAEGPARRTPRPSLASLLAACHLCGPAAVMDYLSGGPARADEAGTPVTAYLREFAHVSLAEEDLW